MIPQLINTISILLLFISCNDKTSVTNTADEFSVKDSAIVGGGCDGCDIMYVGMPANISSVDTSVGWNEPGQKLFIHGTV